MKRKKVGRYVARVEFLACQDEVKAMLSRGYSVAMIFRELESQGKVTMGYAQFNRYTSIGICGVEPMRTAQVRKTSKKKKLDATPEVVPSRSSAFTAPIGSLSDFTYGNTEQK